MTTKEKAKRAAEYRAKLLEHLTPGQTVYCILRHVSASGMSRRISLLVPDPNGGDPFEISGWVGHVLGLRRNDRDGGLVVSGCGMDMGFHLVSSLSRALWPHGHGDMRADYVLRSRWL